MPRTRIKFCGMRRDEDIERAISLGVDAIGLIMVPGSRRALDVDAAESLRTKVPPLVATVLLISDPQPDWLKEICSRIRPDLLQFHGSEPVAVCLATGLPYLKALPMGSPDVARDMLAQHRAHAAGWVLDGHAKGEPGGSGRSFDWSRLPELDKPLVLAGGLHAENVGAAIRASRPHAVDVSSGIESVPGAKDHQMMRRFVEAVRAMDNQLFEEESE